MTVTTTTKGSRTQEQSAIRTLKGLLIAAVLTTAGAALAGVGLLVIDPESGSAIEAALGFTAAVSGLLTALLAVAIVIYAQVRNLWQFVPFWIRAVVFGVVVVAVVRSLIISFT